MTLGTQFTGNVPGLSTRRWFTHSWNAASQVQWLVVPTNPAVDGDAQLELKVQTTRQSATLVKYHLEIRNLAPYPVDFEARFAIL